MMAIHTKQKEKTGVIALFFFCTVIGMLLYDALVTVVDVSVFAVVFYFAVAVLILISKNGLALSKHNDFKLSFQTKVSVER